METKTILKKYFLLVLIVVVLGNIPIPHSEAAEQTKATELAKKMELILKDERLTGAITGVSIRNAKTGELVYSSYGEIRLHPASNMKLLTAAAAMEQLGPEYRFSTEVLTEGKIEGEILQGNLYLKGKGDPTLMEKDLSQFAKELKAKGMNKISGALVADDSWYDDNRLSQDLNWSDETNYTGAQVSALTISPTEDYDTGTVMVEVNPETKIGEKAKISIKPANNYVEMINRTKTVPADSKKKLSFERKHGTNQIIVKGSVPLKSKMTKSWVAVWEPTNFVLHVFKKVLQENGIEFINKSGIKIGKTPKDAKLLAERKSIPLKEILVPFMKLSNNGHGEILTKEMGKVLYGEGSWDKGLQVIKETITSFGVNGNTIMLRDGSGMSHKNMIPANELSQLLYAIQNKSWFQEFVDSLPVAGNPDRLVGGTLRSRLTDEVVKGRVKAKTGSITGVSTISGYVYSNNDEKWIFSIMINNYIGSSVLPIEDLIIKALAESDAN